MLIGQLLTAPVQKQRPFMKSLLKTIPSFSALMMMVSFINAQSPGAVSGATLWFKGDNGLATSFTSGSGSTAWTDKSGNNNHLFVSSAALPTFNSGSSANAMNFNPTLTFTGNSLLQPTNNTGPLFGINGTSSFTVVAVTNQSAASRLVGGNGANQFEMDLSPTANTVLGITSPAISSPTIINANTIQVVNRSGNNFSAFDNADGTGVTTGTNTISYPAGAAFTLGMPTAYCSGSSPTMTPSGSFKMTGTMSEFIVFPSDVKNTGTQMRQVVSYLALKYGISLTQATAQDYLASDGTTKMWTNATAGSFINNIFGIGRDDNSALHQKVSASSNARGIVTAATINDFALTNTDASRTGLTNLQFLTISDNSPSTGNPTWTAGPSSSIKSILSSQWMVQNTGSVGGVYLQFNTGNTSYAVPALANGGNYYLIYDNSGTISATSTLVKLSNTSGNLWSTSSPITFSNGAKFTLAEMFNPGGVGGASLWLKAGAGTSTTTQGAIVSTWTEQVGAITYTGENGPTYQTKALNFNPGVLYPDGTSAQHRDITKTNGPLAASSTSFFVGLKNSNNNDGWHSIWQLAPANGVDNYFFPEILNSGGAEKMGLGWSLNSGTTLNDAVSTLTWPHGQAKIAKSTFSAPNASTALNNGGVFNYSNAVPSSANGPFRYYIIGNADAVQEPFGTVGETIVFPTTTLTALQTQQVSSYLALKYGISLDQTTAQDYVASNGTTKMWNATTAGTFNNNIFGIGRDDNGTLDQRISASVNAKGIATLATINNFTLANTDASRTSLNNLNFEVIADNGDASHAWTITNTLTGYKINTLQWQVQETGTIGTVYVQFDTANTSNSIPARVSTSSPFYLITDPNGDGNFADGTAIPLTNTSGSLWSTSIDLTNGMKFTIGTSVVVGPGGVAGAGLWLKGNTGVITSGSNVTAWNDNSGNGINASASSNNPTVNASNLMNFNGVVSFNRASQQAMDGLVTNTIASNNANYSYRAVAFPKSLSAGLTYTILIGGNDGTNSTVSLFGVGSNKVGDSWNGNNASSTNLVSITQPSIMGSNYNNTTGRNIYLNGLQNGSSATTNHGAILGLTAIGVRTGTANTNFDGDISEIIAYPRSLTNTEMQKIDVYLAIKYGISLDQSVTTYINSAGTTMYSIDATYNKQIIGLERDDASGLLQKQSKTTDDSLRLFVSTLAASNAANTGSIANDLSSIIIGNNGGRLRGDASLAKPAGISYRLGRTWKITNNNFAGTYSMEIKWDSTGPFNIADVRLLVSSSSDFSSATVFDGSALTFSIGSIIVGGINPSVIPNGTSFITIASASPLTTLPVTLLSFKAALTTDKSVKLDWKTSSEINMDRFAVEHSADGLNWATLATVAASGNSVAMQSYTAVDKNPYPGTTYYRIKQIDRDGKFEYSEIRTVNATGNTGAVVIYPNPAHNQVTIKADAAELKTFKVFTLSGADVTGMVKTSINNNVVLIADVSKLAGGTYIIKTATSINKIVKE